MGKKILITGAAGFIGKTLTLWIIKHATRLEVTSLILTDITDIPPIHNDQADSSNLSTLTIKHIVANLSDVESIQSLSSSCNGITTAYLLHGIMSSVSEADPALGMVGNFESTRNLLSLFTAQCATIPQIIYASSVAVYGNLESAAEHSSFPINETSPIPRPSSTYGTQKMLCEYLLHDFSRRNSSTYSTSSSSSSHNVLILRLPTIMVRPGKPTGAASSFISSLVREPVNNEMAVLPVSRATRLWVCSPRVVIGNLVYATTMTTMKGSHTLNLPGITVTVQEIMNALCELKGSEMMNLIRVENDEMVQRIIGSWPAVIDTGKAEGMGFRKNESVREIVLEYLEFVKGEAV